MTEKKYVFRFRFPWLSTSKSYPPTAKTQPNFTKTPTSTTAPKIETRIPIEFPLSPTPITLAKMSPTRSPVVVSSELSPTQAKASKGTKSQFPSTSQIATKLPASPSSPTIQFQPNSSLEIKSRSPFTSQVDTKLPISPSIPTIQIQQNSSLGDSQTPSISKVVTKSPTIPSTSIIQSQPNSSLETKSRSPSKSQVDIKFPTSPSNPTVQFKPNSSLADSHSLSTFQVVTKSSSSPAIQFNSNSSRSLSTSQSDSKLPASQSNQTTQFQSNSSLGDSQTLSTSQAVTKSSPSPSSPTTQSQPNSQPSFSSQAASQSRAATSPLPTLTTTPQSLSTSQTAPQLLSPSHLVSFSDTQPYIPPSSQSITEAQLQPVEAATQFPLSRTSQPAQESSQPPIFNRDQSSVTKKEEHSLIEQKPALKSEKEESKQAGAHPALKPQLQRQMTSDAIFTSQHETSNKTTTQVKEMVTQPSREPIPVADTEPPPHLVPLTPPAPQKSDSLQKNTDLEPPEKLGGSTEVMKEAVEKPNGNDYKEVKEKGIEPLIEASGLPSAEGRGKRQTVKQETFDMKEKSTTSIPNEKQTKTMVKQPEHQSKVVESRQKPFILIDKQVPQHEMAIWHSMDEKPTIVIAHLGENVGASMELGCELARQEREIRIHRGSENDAKGNSEASTNGEGSSKERKSVVLKVDQGRKAYISSNIQSINNSIMFNSFITEINSTV